jgi:hypothetical protein
MKKMVILAAVLLFFFIMTVPAAAAGHPENERDYRKADQPRHVDRDRDRTDFRGYYDRDRDRDYEYRNPEMRQPGYRSEAHGRRLGHHYVHKHHEYHYEGHWNSWGLWERYKMRHPDRFRHLLTGSRRVFH